MSFAQKILNWYHENQRDLPWRRTRDPYKVWLSEIILQQTRVVQGMPYYLRFVDAFPTVQDLAKAPEEQVLKLWQGLGYYSRARNLHATAKIVANNFDGQFPNTYKELKSLKGVGDYTASAIASFCFDAPEPVVDGNVYRVLSRYFGVDIPINSTKGIKYFKELAREVMDSGNIRDYNQGIMEFGAVQCAPKKPYCLLCPLQESCVAVKDGKVSELPLKLNKTKVKNRYFNYVIPIDPENNTILEQRTGKGIWQNLYQFPLVESDKNLKAEELKLLIQGNGQLPEYESLSLYNNETIVHKLSHQHLHTKFWILKTSYILEEGTPWKKIGDFPVPVLIADFIKTFKI
ncbi:A/G-specific adenine glycosylase [Muricauda ruestringensis]|uniref:A/G-specific adenine glycosylase n=1 Tax=Flagellimonas ruestringensis TaxID=111501 RepID=UPI001CD4835A|nr:A/G-specific adenine glycosylase [Allomuricauda ruestringensis]MCA0958776.1 A/G-specific adenine glycosylase [Allomuricauda ruestringensis]